MCTTHTLELERPDHVGGQRLGVGQGDAHHSVGLGSPHRPVLVAFHSCSLFQPGGEQDYHQCDQFEVEKDI